MPWSVKRLDSCPESKPWAVVNDESGATEGCHETEQAAQAQQAALYANVPEARSPDGKWEDHVRDIGQAELVLADNEPELRSAPFTDLEVTADGGTFEGLAAVYDIEADLGDFTEAIQRGAFRKAIADGHNVPMVYDHNLEFPILATTRGKTLELSDDARGLRVKASVANHFMGDAVRELVQRGDIAGMSFGFIAGKGNQRIEQRRDKPHRLLTGFRRLLDVSPTWNEAYSGTEAAFRSLRALTETDSPAQAQQILTGEQPQLEDGALMPDDAVVEAVQESRTAGATTVAARRRLHLMGLTLPKEEQT